MCAYVCVCVCEMSCGTEGYGMLEFPLLHGLCVCVMSCDTEGSGILELPGLHGQ